MPFFLFSPWEIPEPAVFMISEKGLQSWVIPMLGSLQAHAAHLGSSAQQNVPDLDIPGAPYVATGMWHSRQANCLEAELMGTACSIN